MVSAMHCFPKRVLYAPATPQSWVIHTHNPVTPGGIKQYEWHKDTHHHEHDLERIYYVDRSKFGAETPAKVGAIIAFTQPDGTELPGLVREVQGESVTIDFNHPLAGQRLTFEVDIIEVQG